MQYVTVRDLGGVKLAKKAYWKADDSRPSPVVVVDFQRISWIPISIDI